MQIYLLLFGLKVQRDQWKTIVINKKNISKRELVHNLQLHSYQKHLIILKVCQGIDETCLNMDGSERPAPPQSGMRICDFSITVKPSCGWIEEHLLGAII